MFLSYSFLLTSVTVWSLVQIWDSCGCFTATWLLMSGKLFSNYFCVDVITKVLAVIFFPFLVRQKDLPIHTQTALRGYKTCRLWTFITCSSISFVVDHSIRVPNRSYLRRSLMKLHVSLAKLFPFLAIRVFNLLYISSPQSLSCWRCHTNYLHFSKIFFLLVPRNSFMFSLPSP